MESGNGRKRMWEDDSSINLRYKRQGSQNAALVASTSRQPSPLPQRTGCYSRNSRLLNQRQLPPLNTSSSNTSAQLTTSALEDVSAHAQQPRSSGNFRPRSQSLFNVFQHSHSQDHQAFQERPLINPLTLNLGPSPEPLASVAHQPYFDTSTAPDATGVWNCCSSDCEGGKCSETRVLMHRLVAQVMLLERKVSIATNTEHPSSYQPPKLEQFSTKVALEQALGIIQCSNIELQGHLDRQVLHTSQPKHSPSMRRGQHHLEEPEEQSPPSRHYPSAHHGYSRPAHPNPVSEDTRRLPFHGQMNSLLNSPHHTASSSGSALPPPQSPMQAPQPIRSAILPSPTSLSFPNASALPSLSPPSAAGQTSAQHVHLQDLQHQINVKTSAFQTLQHEYDTLLQKLECQRRKYATLENKFEVSGVEINSLTDEKERLQEQVSALENQVEELQQSRDEARHQLVADGAQYMRIVEMANKLQGQDAKDKEKWEAERAELEQRIRILEEAIVTGAERAPSKAELPSSSSTVASIVSHSSTISAETINVLRAEVARLRSRTQALEKTLSLMQQESISLQVTARQLVESGGRLEALAKGAIGTDG
ncbi:hypothetical protein GQ44DRAFT_730543 [Phaeosphaeriaceae sp. PMI808]|nr:hypothetical protein GQ44DRAFT_730543 [Phaeosphaeriaceae sp. PMI808]